MIHFRNAIDSDMTHIRDIDLKCHEQLPADEKWWLSIAVNKQAGCTVGCKSQVPVGMLVFEKQIFKLSFFTEHLPTLHLHKLCVRKEFRSQMIGQKLMSLGYDQALKNSCQYMTMSIPEYRCCPGKEADVSGWLMALGFRATSILPTKLSLWGQEFDQFLFCFKVTE